MHTEKKTKEKKKSKHPTQYQIKKTVENAEKILKDTNTYACVIAQAREQVSKLTEDSTLTEKYQLVLSILKASLTDRDKELLQDILTTPPPQV